MSNNPIYSPAVIDMVTVSAEYCVYMEKLRETADRLETIMPRTLWPFPSYGTLLYMV